MWLMLLHSHLKRNSEVFQGLLMKVLLVKEQQQLKNTPVKTSKMYGSYL